MRARALANQVLLAAVIGVACGCASAAFLLLLDRATAFRIDHRWLVYTLPIAGVVIGSLYGRWGKTIAGGNNLVLDTLHEDRPQLPLRMAPMVLVGTVITHLFGGSAGREGTAVQMGASIADAIGIKTEAATRRALIVAGMAGGFASVFGTPLAGAIFGVEVLAIGKPEWRAIPAALVAAVVGDQVTRRLGILHTPYPRALPIAVTPRIAVLWIVFALTFAMAAVVFIELTHALKKLLEKRVPSLPLRMLIGGTVLVILWRGVGSDDYLGLGVPTIVRAFTDPTLSTWAFAFKLLFTAITLSAGFLGGEVTPLFFVGATLGAVVARHAGVPIALGAGVGLAAVFGAAANAPIALSVMAVELLGASIAPHVFVVVILTYLCTGHRGIYGGQRIHRHKWIFRRWTVGPSRAIRDVGRG